VSFHLVGASATGRLHAPAAFQAATTPVGRQPRALFGVEAGTERPTLDDAQLRDCAPLATLSNRGRQWVGRTYQRAALAWTGAPLLSSGG